MTRSMSRVAHCIDNGTMEGFWGILKRERYYGKRFYSKKALVDMIENFIRYYTLLQHSPSTAQARCPDAYSIKKTALLHKSTLPGAIKKQGSRFDPRRAPRAAAMGQMKMSLTWGAL